MNFLTSRPRGAKENNVQVLGGNEAELRQFMVHQYAGVSYSRGSTTIYVGQLSPDAQIAQIPVPEGVQVVGSIVTENELHEILLTTDMSPKEALEVCEQTAFKAEWRFVEEWPTMPPVFVDAETIKPRTYCKQAIKTVLTIKVGNAAEITSVSLSMRPQADPCTPRMMPRPFDMQQNLPSLQTPPGARLLMNLSGGGGNSSRGGSNFSSTAVLETEISIGELALMYEEQLRKIDWQQVDKNLGEKSAMSTWQFSKSDSLWVAYFNIAFNPTKNGECLLWLHIYQQVT